MGQYKNSIRHYDQEMVEKEVVRQEKRPNRKIYSITDKGRTAFRDWLISKPDVDAPHSSPLIQVFFAGQYPDEVVIKMFRFMSSVMDDLMECYKQVPEKIEEYRSQIQSDREMYFWNSTLGLGMRVAKAKKNGPKT